MAALLYVQFKEIVRGWLVTCGTFGVDESHQRERDRAAELGLVSQRLPDHGPQRVSFIGRAQVQQRCFRR
jgi:hypothetical protein